MSEGLLKDMLKYLPAQVVPGLVGPVSMPIVTRIFPPAEYGNYSLAMATVAILSMLFGWLPTSVIRYYPAYAREGRLDAFNATIVKLAAIALAALACLYYGIVILGRPWMPARLSLLLMVGGRRVERSAQHPLCSRVWVFRRRRDHADVLRSASTPDDPALTAFLCMDLSLQSSAQRGDRVWHHGNHRSFPRAHPRTLAGDDHGHLYLCGRGGVRSQRNVAREACQIIVVDNGSTDHTEQTVRTVQQRFAQIECLYEEKLGLSIARNAGVRRAIGPIICFTDDDAVPSSDYVAEILCSFDDPLVACVGGKVTAVWPDEVPCDWFGPRYANVVAQTCFGDTARRMRKGEFPFGCNISFRKEVFETFGGFDECQGKRGGNNIWGEEIDLCHKLQRHGFRFFHNPRAVVSHVVGRNRATQHYFVQSLFGKGVTEGYQKLANRGTAVFTAYLLLKACRLAVTSLYYLLAGAMLSDARRFRVRCAISWYAGYLYFLAVRDELGSAPPRVG